MANNNSKLDQRFPTEVTCIAEMATLVRDLNNLRNENVPSSELSYAERRVRKAISGYNEIIKSKRISELLSMGTGIAMWKEFLAHRTVTKFTLIRPSISNNAYRLNKNDGSNKARAEYLLFSDLNASYIASEIIRRDLTGKIINDCQEITLARRPSFGLDFKNMAVAIYRNYIGRNDTHGVLDQSDIPSINKCVRVFNTAVDSLLPEHFFADNKPFNVYKSEIRELELMIHGRNSASHTKIPMKTIEHWFLCIIQHHIENEKNKVTTPSRNVELIKTSITFPSSTICFVNLQNISSHEDLRIIIVSDILEQDPAKGIYWFGNVLPSILLSYIQLNSKQTFIHKGVKCRIKDYVKNSNFENYVKIVTNFCDSAVPQTCYVFAQKNIAHFQTQNYELVTAMIPCANCSSPIPISIYYDKLTQRYFMNEESYMLAKEKYGLPYLKIQTTSDSQRDTDLNSLQEWSKLYLLGYNVNAATESTSTVRRQVLIDALSNGVIQKHEIINHLEWLIRTRSGMPRMANAVSKWRVDLQFFSTYQAEQQRNICIDHFSTKCDSEQKPKT